MRVIFLDTEGNGKSYDELCQLSYVICDNGEMIYKNMYFKVGAMDPHAFAVHKLSKFALWSLSNGRIFADSALAIKDDIESCDMIIGHNVSADTLRLRNEFERINVDIAFPRELCTMRFFNNAVHAKNVKGKHKFPKLSELCAHYKIKDSEIKKMCTKGFGVKDGLFHDARFDVCATFLCVRTAALYGDIKGVFDV